MATDPTISEDVRRTKLKAWLDSVWHHFKKTEQWGKLRTIKESGVGRTTIHGWESDWTNRRPTMDRMIQFCTNLGVDPATPFEIMGWNISGDDTTRVEEPADTPAIRRIKYKLAHPNLDEREEYYLNQELDRLASRPLESGDPIRRTYGD